MRRVVIYKSTYGSTAQYAGWIANELGCEAYDVKSVNADMLNDYDTIIYGGGLYAEVIAGFSFLTKNIEAIKTLKKIMSAKTNPTKMEKLLIELCDADGDFSDKSLINDLVAYAKD